MSFNPLLRQPRELTRARGNQANGYSDSIVKDMSWLRMKPQAQESLWQASGSRKECIHPGACCVSPYRGHVRVRRGHLHQVDVVGSILPGRVVVIDVQEGDIHLWATGSAVVC